MCTYTTALSQQCVSIDTVFNSFTVEVNEDVDIIRGAKEVYPQYSPTLFSDDLPLDTTYTATRIETLPNGRIIYLVVYETVICSLPPGFFFNGDTISTVDQDSIMPPVLIDVGGPIQPEEPIQGENIPTMGQWGLICLGLLLTIFAVVAIKQKDILIVKPNKI